MLLASEDIKQKQNERTNERTNGSVPFPPVSLQRQVVCLTVAAGVHVFIRGEPVSSYFSMACCSVVSY